MTKRSIEVIIASFLDDPKAVIDLLMEVASRQKKKEPEFSEAWAKIHRNLDLAREGTRPLY